MQSLCRGLKQPTDSRSEIRQSELHRREIYYKTSDYGSDYHVLPGQVCDYRCGSGVYEDLHCNWRGLGRTCRFCFQDAFEAHLADEIAKTNGSRVILCETHEPPLAIWSSSVHKVGRITPSLELPLEAVTKAPDVDIPALAATTYSGNVTRGELCAFMIGYFEFLPETTVAVSSVVHFMPGMRVGIATNPRDFHVFNR